MSRAGRLLFCLAAPLLLSSCGSTGGSWDSGDSIGSLRGQKIDVKEEVIEGGLEKAIAGYRKFLQDTPEAEMTPEALRRLADLKVQAVEGVYDPNTQSIQYTKPGQSRVVSPIGKKQSDREPPVERESLGKIEERSQAQGADVASGKADLGSHPGGMTMQQQMLQDDAN